MVGKHFEVGMGIGSWFDDNMKRLVGDAANSLFFWTDEWVGDEPFCVRFRRLVELVETTVLKVAEMCQLGWEVRRRSGRDGCVLGRKRWWGTIVLCFTMLFYMFNWRTNGTGCYIMSKGTQSAVFITTSYLLKGLLKWSTWLIFGTKKGSLKVKLFV